MKENNKKKSKFLVKIIGSSSILLISSIMIVLICVLMLLDFFGAKLTKEKIQSNIEYADAYTIAVNKYLKNGYVPLQRILYFHLEDDSLTIDTLYTMNQDKDTKTTKEINEVCKDERVKNHGACTESNLKDNEDYLVVTTARFNFPLDDDYTITSFFNEERTIFDEKNIHTGWDLATDAETPIYSVCSGTVEKINYTQEENIPYPESQNIVGNSITIKCDEDYDNTYYVVFAHLYPNSAKVNVGDKVNHWTEIASVGTTGHSTGNHLHYQVYDENWELVDGMQLIDFTLNNKTDDYFDNDFDDKYNPNDALLKPYN